MRNVQWVRAKGTAGPGASVRLELRASTGTQLLSEEGGSQLKNQTPAALGWAITTSAGKPQPEQLLKMTSAKFLDVP